MLATSLAMVVPIGHDAARSDDDSPTVSAAGVDPAMFPLDPQRFAETREGAPTFDGQFEGEGRRAAGSTYQVTIAGRGGVPVDAAGAVIYLTAVDPAAWGYMTVSACEDGPPIASSVNYDTGVTVGNEIVADLSATGALCVFTFAATDLTIDVVGYVPAGNSIVTFRDRRLLETREGAPTFDGQSEGIGRTTPGSTTAVKVAGRAGIPVGTTSVIVNVAALDPADDGFVTVHPCLPGLPPASSLNYSPGVDRANELIAQLDGDGEICVFTQHGIDLIMDVAGYVPPGTNYVPTASRRYLETRPGAPTFDGQNQGEGIRPAGSTYTLPVAGRGPVPAGAMAVVANVAAVDPVSGGFLTVHPCLGFTPTSASLNYRAGVNGANEIVARVDSDGEICLFTFAPTHLIVDVTGYLMPDLTATTDSYDAFGNVLLEVGVPPTGPPAKQVAGSVLDNDIGGGALTVTAFDATSSLGGTVAMNADGTFTYTPPAGATGITDTFEYTMTDGSGNDTAAVMIDLTELVWFVDNTAASGGDGTSVDPFDALAAAGVASGAGDTIFVYRGNGADTGYDQGIVLDANQRLIGEIAGLTVAGEALVPPGGRPNLSAASGANTVSLGPGSFVTGFALDITGSGAALASSAAGADVEDVVVTANSEGVDLDGATGTFTFTDVDITSSGGAAFRIHQGDPDVDVVNGTIVQTGNAPAVEIFAHPGGSVDFDAATTVTATNGVGMLFDSADGTYDFRGQVTLNGGDAGIDLFASSGTFTFADVDVTSPSPNAAVDINGSKPSKLYLGAGSTITQANDGILFAVSNGHSGEFQLRPGATMTATDGTGLRFNNADGAYDFQGQVTLNGGDSGIDIFNGASGTFTFSDVDITASSTVAAIDIDTDAAANLHLGAGSTILSQALSSGVLRVGGGHTGGIELEAGATMTATAGDGLKFDNADGAYDFQGAIDLTGGNTGIEIIGGSAGTFTFADATITDPSGWAVRIVDLAAGGDVDYTGGITKTTGEGLVSVETTAAGTTIDFHQSGASTLTASNTIGSGVQIFDADGDITFDTPMSIDDPGFSAIFHALGAGTFTFRDVVITNQSGPGNAGVDIIADNSTFNFTNLDIQADYSTYFHPGGPPNRFGGLAFLAQPGNVVNIFGSDNDMSNVGGPVIALSGGTSFDITLDELSSTDSSYIGPVGQDGIVLFGAGTGTFTVTGTTTIDTTGDQGIDISDVSGTITFADVDISNTGSEGISTGAVQGTPAAVTINGGTFDNIGADALAAGLAVFPASGGNLTVNDVVFTNVAGFVGNFFNSALGGAGNTATPFSCNDAGSNTGFITFNAGADTCP